MIKKTTSKNLGRSVRARGNTYEVQIAKELRELGWKDACTSRAESKAKDNAGIDICNASPLNIQCKCRNNFASPIKDLKSIKGNNGYYDIVFQKVVNKGEYVTMAKKDFYSILETLKTEEIF